MGIWNIGVAHQGVGAFLGALSYILEGYAIGYVPAFIENFRNDTNVPFKMTEGEEDWFASLIKLGAVMGCLCAGTLTHYFGRKRVLIGLLVPYSITWVPIIFAAQCGPTLMLIGRFFVGFIFLGMPIGQLLIGEVAQPRWRGFLSYWGLIGVNAGMLTNYTLALFMSWQSLAIFNAIFPWVFLPLLLTAQESPTWLLTKDREAEARFALNWYRGRKQGDEAQICPKDSLKIETEFQIFKRQIEKNYSRKEAQGFGGYLLLLNKRYRKPVVVLFFLMVGRQFSGVYAIVSFQTDIFREAGSSVEPLTATTIVGAIQLACLLVASVLTDRIGRKRLTVYGMAIMAAATAIFGLHSYLGSHCNCTFPSNTAWIPLVCLATYIGGFSLGIGPSAHAFLGEIFPPQIKNQASSLAIAVNQTASFFTILSFHPMERAMGKSGVFWFYSFVSVLVIFVCALGVKETKGKTLAEIEKIVMHRQSQTISISENVGPIAIAVIPYHPPSIRELPCPYAAQEQVLTDTATWTKERPLSSFDVRQLLKDNGYCNPALSEEDEGRSQKPAQDRVKDGS